ncbi:MAG: flavodoxin family protein [Deltaproteobacteria bacterium]|nr:flavodoxin family protein [Deltaproteobacteria bacterium]
MKIIAINGSPHGKRGSCAQLVQRMFAACEAQGAETEMIALQRRRINFCVGCGKCLSEGVCPQKDDVLEIQDKMRAADGIIFASPVYVMHVTGQMKTFIDRCLPMGHRPSLQGKYAAAVSAYAGIGNIDAVADYLLHFLVGQGAYPVGKVCAFTTNIAVGEQDLEKAAQLGRDMIEAIRQKKTFNWEKLREKTKEFKEMKEFITERKDFAREDYKYWQERGWIDGKKPS